MRKTKFSHIVNRISAENKDAVLASSERRSVKLSVDYFSLISIYKSPVIQYLHSYLAVIFVGHQ